MRERYVLEFDPAGWVRLGKVGGQVIHRNPGDPSGPLKSVEYDADSDLDAVRSALIIMHVYRQARPSESDEAG